MDFMHVTGEEVRTAQSLTGATMASLFLVGLVPGLRAYAGRIRVAIALAYLAAAAGFMIYLLIR